MLRANAEYSLAYLSLIRGRLDESAEALERGVALSEQLGDIGDSEPGADLTRYALALLRDGPAAAERYMFARLPEIEPNTLLRSWLPAYRYQLAKAHWLAERLTEARGLADGLAVGGPFPDFLAVPQARAILDGMLATSAGRYAEAEEQFRAAVAFLPAYYGVLFWLDDPRVLLARCYERWGRPREALEALRPLLEECERLDTPGVILKVGPGVVAPLLRLAAERGVHAPFAARMLGILEPTGVAGATPAPESFLVPDTGETLSARELDVLRQLAAGASNATIADALFISPNTVKTHVARILAKLGVASRTQAAAHARDLAID
jgi:DNA-binding CsgD family transcriptional regulator